MLQVQSPTMPLAMPPSAEAPTVGAGSSTPTPAPTGRNLARRRLALGVTRRQVALALGIHFHTYCGWEQGRAPLPAERRDAWERALAIAARVRADQLAREGFTLADLPRDLARALAQYQAIAS